MSWSTTYAVATDFLPPSHPLFVAVMRSLPIGLLFVAAYRLPGGVAATAGAGQPLLVVLFSWLILSERQALVPIVAAIIGFVGVGLLVLGPSVRLDGVGLLAASPPAIAMGLGTRWQPPVSLMVLTAWQLTFGGLMLLPVALMV